MHHVTFIDLDVFETLAPIAVSPDWVDSTYYLRGVDRFLKCGLETWTKIERQLSSDLHRLDVKIGGARVRSREQLEFALPRSTAVVARRLTQSVFAPIQFVLSHWCGPSHGLVTNVTNKRIEFLYNGCTVVTCEADVVHDQDDIESTNRTRVVARLNLPRCNVPELSVLKFSTIN
jgi:hypothetical protein